VNVVRTVVKVSSVPLQHLKRTNVKFVQFRIGYYKCCLVGYK
jgi:hypothetical protein